MVEEQDDVVSFRSSSDVMLIFVERGHLSSSAVRNPPLKLPPRTFVLLLIVVFELGPIRRSIVGTPW